MAMESKKLRELYKISPPADSANREALVKDVMTIAVLPNSSGRPSVEAPLHESFDANFVVHTHPAIVNGMTCSQQGAEICKSLFPDALWIEYVDPGYTLCMQVRQRLTEYATEHGHQPEMVFLKNHGVFVAVDTPAQVKEIYGNIMNTLREAYRKANVSTELEIAPRSDEAATQSIMGQIKKVFGETEAAFICYSGSFDIAEGPLTPDHIVY